MTFQTVMLSGQAAPGAFGRFFSYFLYPAIGDSGQIAFNGVLSGSTLSDEGIWVGAPGAVQLAAREGVAAPGAGTGVSFGGNFGVPTINASGLIAFRANLQGQGVDGSNSQGIWAGGVGSLSMVARRGNQAAGLPAGVTYLALYADPSINDSGEVAFVASISGTGVDGSNDYAIWRGIPGALEMIAREGDAAPGTVGAVFDIFYDQFTLDAFPVLNDLGQVVFRAFLRGGDVNSSNSEGIWRWSPGAGLELVARRGNVAPGTGNLWEAFLNPELGPQGQVTFIGYLVNDDADPFNDRGVWVGEPALVNLVVRSGAAAPGLGSLRLTPNGGELSQTPVSEDDVVTFNAILIDQDGLVAGRAIYSYGPSAAELMVRDNSPAPGLPGVMFGGSPGLLGPRPISSVLFNCLLTGNGVTSSNDDSLWIKDPASAAELVVREGDLFDVGAGVMRTISFFEASPLTWNLTSCYNAARQLTFRLHFTDNTEAVVVTSVPVPVIPGDMDGDGDVDGDDFAIFAGCMNGPELASLPSCEDADLSGDGDVDLADFAAFQQVFNAP